MFIRTHLLDYIDSYLKGKIDLNSKTVVDDLVRRGILAFNDEEYVKFKFDFLFRYFLALYINYDVDFQKQVFALDSCLNYFDEIVYYSGLQTDDEKLLEISQQLLSSVFVDLNQDIIQNWNKLDTFLNTRQSLSAKMSMKQIKKKPTEKELEEMYDEELKSIPIKRSIEKRTVSKNRPLDKTLKFASLIFKNLEDLDDQNVRSQALQNIVTSSISLMLYTRDALIYYYLKNNSTPNGFPKNINFEVFIRLLPLLHQVMISDWVGTEKTKLVITEKIDNHALNVNLSEFEKFIDIFTYADVKGKDSFEIVKEFLKNNKYRYIKDFGIVKLIIYYYLRSKSKESDNKYLNLISDLKKQLNQIESKSAFMKQLSEGRERDIRKTNKE